MDANVVVVSVALTVCVIFACATAAHVAERKHSKVEAMIALACALALTLAEQDEEGSQCREAE